MDFVGPFPEVDGYNYLWVVLCRLTSMTHLIPIHTSTKATELSWFFLREVIRLHGLPVSLVSDRDSKFTSRWWREVHRLLGVKLLMSTAFHPQTDGASERIIQSITQILRTVVRADQKDWLYRLPMTEFAINSSINASTGYAPFFLNGGHIPSMIRDLGNLGVGVPGVAEFAKKALLHLMDAHDALIEALEFQAVYANRHRMKEPLIKDGDMVYLSTKNLRITLGWARKLVPKFLGPYKVLKTHRDHSTYKLELPEDLRKRRIHDTFHVNLLRPFIPNDDDKFPNRDHSDAYDLGAPPDAEFTVNEIVEHRWIKGNIQFKVHWNDGDATWESLEKCNVLAALDDYLKIKGCKRPEDLPKAPTRRVRK